MDWSYHLHFHLQVLSNFDVSAKQMFYNHLPIASSIHLCTLILQVLSYYFVHFFLVLHGCVLSLKQHCDLFLMIPFYNLVYFIIELVTFINFSLSIHPFLIILSLLYILAFNSANSLFSQETLFWHQIISHQHTYLNLMLNSSRLTYSYYLIIFFSYI